MKDWRSITCERAGHGGVGVQPADPALHAQQPRERPAVLLAEVRVARQRLLARLAAARGRGAARARRPGRSRARCGCPRPSSAGSARRCRRRRRRRPRPARASGGGSSCPGSARPGRRGRSARRTVGSLTWSRGSKEPTPTRSSSPAGKLQRVARAHVGGVEPQLEVVAVAASGWTSSPRDSRASGGWIGLGALESTRRQPSASTISGARQVAAVGVHGVDPRRAPSTLAVSNCASGACARSSAHSSR